MKRKRMFSFGKNWVDYLRYINEERIEIAKSSLIEFLNLKDLNNLTFLDIGCGSGLFSYVAYLLGARKIVSFDFDPFSVKSCKILRKIQNNPENWEIYYGSILNENFISKIGKFDIVYSWGVLHHTGEMWKAIKNAAKLVNDNGYFYIAIYNNFKRIDGSKTWLKIKKIYNISPKFIKIIFQFLSIMNFFINSIAILKNPLKQIKNYEKDKRGMNFRVDVVDWLGGYPYEFASVKEILRFMKKNYPDFKIINIKQENSLANNWYLFNKKSN